MFLPPQLRQRIHNEIVSFLVNNPVFQQFASKTQNSVRNLAQGQVEKPVVENQFLSTFIKELRDSAKKILPFGGKK